MGMVEEGCSQIPLERVVVSLVKVETQEKFGLEYALRRIGFGITSELSNDRECVLISVAPLVKPDSSATLVLAFIDGGIFHIPQRDKNWTDENAPLAKLTYLRVDDREKYVHFSFDGLDDPNDKRFIELRTEFNRRVWGSL